MAHALAMVNPSISAEVVEAEEFPELARQFQVMAVPKTVINDTAELLGAVPAQYFVNAILTALGKPELELPGPEGEDPS